MILGNHEILHLYKSPLSMLYFNLEELQSIGGLQSLHNILSAQHPIGRFLRSQPAIRIIGKSVFVHAGLDTQFLRKYGSGRDSIHLFNNILKNSLLHKEHDSRLPDILGIPLGSKFEGYPFWTRGLDMMQRALVTEEICHNVSLVLDVLNVSRMIIGHNCQMDQKIKSFCNQKLWLIDCDIKSGGMEVLQIQNDVAMPLCFQYFQHPASPARSLDFESMVEPLDAAPVIDSIIPIDVALDDDFEDIDIGLEEAFTPYNQVSRWDIQKKTNELRLGIKWQLNNATS